MLILCFSFFSRATAGFYSQYNSFIFGGFPLSTYSKQIEVPIHRSPNRKRRLGILAMNIGSLCKTSIMLADRWYSSKATHRLQCIAHNVQYCQLHP